MTATLKEPSNPHIQSVYGPMLEKCFAQLKGLSVRDFQPASGTIVVKPAAPETLTEGGIHLPPSAQQAQKIGAVVAVNADADCPYDVGDLVLFRSGGAKMSLDKGDEYLILQYRGCIDDEVLGKFKHA
jgi:co-chaperonin GroES (HSP10)